ncbi:MAG TPA: metallophosphoesterase [Candidatus Limnocylindrales bacterium]|nr:metallophosphoesterase [Candidatus Limnocylindrales bacterium]
MKRCGALLALALLVWATAAFGWSFGVCGDSRDDRNGVFPRILSSVRDSDMEFLLHTGDLARPGGTKSWEAFKAEAADFPKPLYLVIGNHELRGGTREEFARFFGLTTTSYGFTHKDVRFIVLDNAGGEMPDALLDWLKRELAAHPKGKNGIARLVVAMHHPPQTDSIFPHCTRRGYGDQSVKLLKILLRHKVDLVLCSHEHMQMVEDWSGIKTIVSGGAGAPLVPFQKYGFYRIDVTGNGILETFLPVNRFPSSRPK